MMIYRGSHPPPKYQHGETFGGGIVLGRSRELNTWMYTLLHPKHGVFYQYEY